MKSFDRGKLKNAFQKSIIDLYDLLHITVEEFDYYKNTLDGFSVSIEALVSGICLKDQMKREKFHQTRKTSQNILGLLHKLAMTSLPGVCKPPLTHGKNQKPSEQIDIICHDKKLIAKIKNKHNTVWGANKHNVHKTLVNILSEYSGYRCYFVEVLPKNAKIDNDGKIFLPSNRENNRLVIKNKNIIQIDGKSFYQLLTGNENALQELYNNVPSIVAEILNEERSDSRGFVKPQFQKMINSDLFIKNFSMAYDSEAFASRRRGGATKNKLTVKKNSL